MIKSKINIKKYYFHIVGFALLISFLALLIGLAPAFTSLKNQIVSTFNNVKYGNSIKNFNSSDIESEDTKVYQTLTNCPYNLKIKNSIFVEKKEVDQASSNLLSFNKVDDTEDSIPALQIMCLPIDSIVSGFKDTTLSKWQKEDNFSQKFGMNIDDASKLSPRDFYKLYTQKVSSSCQKSDKYVDITFLNNDLYDTFLTEFNTCNYQYPTLNQVIDEYYFFPTNDNQPLLYVRANNLSSFNKDFLITKR